MQTSIADRRQAYRADDGWQPVSERPRTDEPGADEPGIDELRRTRVREVPGAIDNPRRS